MKELGSGVDGLSGDEAERRFLKYGPNELKVERKKSPLSIFLSQFSNALVLILIVAGVVSVLIGLFEESGAGALEKYSDAVVIALVVLANAVIGFMQEYKAEKAIEALKKMVAPTARVFRNGELEGVPAVKLVPGDVVVIETGDKIPADVRLLEEANLRVDEAALTGESVPVGKFTQPVEGDDVFIGDRRNMLYMGTSVAYGRARGVVAATGMETEFGAIAHETQSIGAELSPLQKELEHVGKFILYLVLGICFVVFLLGLLRGLEFMEMFLIGISLAVAAVPEGLPATVTIALALGVQRMAKQHAIIRKLSSVETLGSTTVICSDKTGTLTQNRMTVQKLYCDYVEVDVGGLGYEPKGDFSHTGKLNEEDLDLLLRIGMLCNDATLHHKDGVWGIMGDPTEGALVVAGKKRGFSRKGLARDYPRIGEIPFDGNRKRMTTVHKTIHGNVAYMKGAPDIVIGMCDRILTNGKIKALTSADRETIIGKHREMASNALRMLAMAYREIPEGMKIDEGIERNMVFVGLTGMMDPPREDVPAAVELCKKAGIKIVIITGDFDVTARAVGRMVGLDGGMRVVNGVELDRLNDKQLEEALKGKVIFARASPENKLRVVSALKAMGQVVAVTGDGVNDAPALKKSDIGVAMGITGTDVSKEASSMVLTDDNFASIVNAVKEGRGVYESIKKFLVYLFSSNIGEVIAVFITMLLGLPLILSAIQILWINLATDLGPALALGVDPPDAGIMERKPRDPKKRIIGMKMFTRIMLLGLVVGFGTISVFLWQLHQQADLMKAQTMAFTVIVLYQLANVFNARSEHKSILNAGLFSNKWLLLAVGLSLAMQIAVVHIGFMQSLFKLTPLTLWEWLIAGAVALSVVAIDEIRKLMQK